MKIITAGFYEDEDKTMHILSDTESREFNKMIVTILVSFRISKDKGSGSRTRCGARFGTQKAVFPLHEKSGLIHVSLLLLLWSSLWNPPSPSLYIHLIMHVTARPLSAYQFLSGIVSNSLNFPSVRFEDSLGF